MSLRPGARLGPYEVLVLIGAGGMGEVYKARDTRLDRTVAIKVLPSDLAADPERRQRFEREARTISQLNHPHICTLYDVDLGDGSSGDSRGSSRPPYLVMEHLAGETLALRLKKGPLPLAEALDFAAQVADALAAAHTHGVIHRDLKPSNVLVAADGCAKLIDFGIAKLLEPGSGETTTGLATVAGRMVGTPAYMAPEQARGLAVEARSDIFSFGLLLYELLTGQRPFDRGSWPDTVAAVMRDPVPPLPRATLALPGEALAALQALLDRCLAKEATARPASMSEVARELGAVRQTAERGSAAPGSTHLSARSLVVLPFENLSSDSEQEYFCDGMTEEIITALSKIRNLRVISRNSAMTLKGAKKTTQEIGQLLHVSHVLEGSVRKAGNNLRITAQLIDAISDTHLWAETYTGTLDDVFDIQEKVARAITDALQMTLSRDEQKSLTERPASDAHVLDCYHRAQHEMFLGTRTSFERSLRLLQEGLRTLGKHPLLYSGLAQAHYSAIEFGLESREEALRNAAEFTRRLEPFDSRYAHALLAKRERSSGNLVQAIRHLEDAVTVDPGDVDSLVYLAWSYSRDAGRPAAGGATADRVINIDPLTAATLLGRAGAFWADANHTQALAVFEDMHRREPSMPWANLSRMQLLTILGRAEEALGVAEEALAENPQPAFAQMVTALRHAVLGEREPLVALMTGEVEAYCWNDSDAPSFVCGWFVLVNERDLAFRWLEHWVDRGSINYPYLAHGDPLLQSLRGELRFQRLLDRIKPEWEQFVPRFGPGSWDPVTLR